MKEGGGGGRERELIARWNCRHIIQAYYCYYSVEEFNEAHTRRKLQAPGNHNQTLSSLGGWGLISRLPPGN